MKRYRRLLKLLCLLLVLAKKDSAYSQSAGAVFLQKDSTPSGGYHAVYIDYDTASAGYEGLVPSEEGIRLFAANLAGRSRGFQLPSQRMPASLPRNWIPLHRYRGKYYVYHPCDGIAISAVALTDSTIIHYQGDYDESEAAFLSMFKIFSSREFGLIYTQSSDSNRRIGMSITLVDTARHIAVFRYSCMHDICDEYLMVDAAMTRRFPVIVNDCRSCKQLEFEFDPIDFKSLLRQ